IDAWTLVDEKGKPVPPTKANIRARLLVDDAFAMPVAQAADDLYAKVVLLPLLQGASSSSSRTPTPPATSATTDGPTLPRKPSRRSSTARTQMAGITATR